MNAASLHIELRHALRAIANAKGLAAVLLVSLGLGTGVNAAVYGVLATLLTRGAPGVEDPARLFSIHTSEFTGTAFGPSSYLDVTSMQTGTKAIASIATIDDALTENVRLTTREAEATVRFGAVSKDFFAVLQMPAHAGTLDLRTESDHEPAVISFHLAEQLGGTEGVVGQELTIADRTYTIVGVTAPRFRGLIAGRECDAWVPLTPRGSPRGDRVVAVVARLAPGVTVNRAQDELDRVSADLATRFPASNRGSVVDTDAPRRFTIQRQSRLDPAASEQTMLIGMVVGGASTLLLAAACLNVGGLLLSWSVSRRRELAIKMALGASRAALIRQLLGETLCLSLAGGALGVLFAAWTMRAIPSLFMEEQAAQLDTRMDAWMILMTIGAATLAGAVFGIAPALQGTSAPAVTALRADSGGLGETQGGARLRAWLVTGQVTLSTILLLGTGLLVSSLQHALEGDLAATAKRIAVVSVELPGRFGDVVKGTAHRQLLFERMLKSSHVSRVGWSSYLPLDRARRNRFRIAGTHTRASDTHEFDFNIVTPEYFDVLSLRCIEGRLIDQTDAALSDPVVVVDELLARRYFGKEAVGGKIIDVKGTAWKVVGVVQSGRYRTLQQAPQPTVYFPAAQEYLYSGHLVMRTSVDPALVLDEIERDAGSVGTGGRILGVSTLEGRLEESLTLDRLTITLVGSCGLIALAMSTLGVYGIMVDAVQRRTREIGLRVALGAGWKQIARLVFLEAAYPAIAGLTGGAILVLAVSRAAQAMIYGLPGPNFFALAAAAGLLAVVILLASIIPLRRALSVHPNIALRAE